MISKLKDWFDLTRAYALPTSIFSWLVAFSFASINGGNSTYGFIALLGICLAHLGANVFDDYIDFKYNKNIFVHYNSNGFLDHGFLGSYCVNNCPIIFG